MTNVTANDYSYWLKTSLNTQIGVGNFLEYIIRMIFSSTLSPGDIAIDGGANRGMHSIPMAKIVGESGLVIGFEAIPKLAGELSTRLFENGIKNVLIKSLALGDKTGFVDFHYVTNNDYYSGIKEQQGIPEGAKESAIKISVPLSTLDIEVQSEKKVRFMKLDLEGGEYHALIGAQRIMSEDRPLIVFENGREKSATVYGYQKSEWFSLFEARNYQVYDLFGRNFSTEDWGKASIPWYFIAASRESDKTFVSEKLPHLIDTLSTVFTRHCLTK